MNPEIDYFPAPDGPATDDEVCDQVTDCAYFAGQNNYLSLEFVYLCAENMWRCVLYRGSNSDASYFDVVNDDVGYAYGYSGTIVPFVEDGI